jgi:two-component system chemotaxis response regulator CheB
VKELLVDQQLEKTLSHKVIAVGASTGGTRAIEAVLSTMPVTSPGTAIRSGGTYLVKIKNGPRVHYQRPSVDVLFQSVAKNAGRNAVGLLLTGMGADGAKGMLSMQENGANTMGL